MKDELWWALIRLVHTTRKHIIHLSNTSTSWDSHSFLAHPPTHIHRQRNQDRNMDVLLFSSFPSLRLSECVPRFSARASFGFLHLSCFKFVMVLAHLTQDVSSLQPVMSLSLFCLSSCASSCVSVFPVFFFDSLVVHVQCVVSLWSFVFLFYSFIFLESSLLSGHSFSSSRLP